jgi:hypothetical protein
MKVGKAYKPFRLSEDIVTLYNPSPEYTKQEAYDDADFPLTGGGREQHVFEVDCQWSAGAEMEMLTIQPQEKRQIVRSAADLFVDKFGHRGLVILDDFPSEYDAALEGLSKALVFWTERGSEELMKTKLRVGLTDVEFQRMRMVYRSWYVNEAKERRIRQALEDLKSGEIHGESTEDMEPTSYSDISTS